MRCCVDIAELDWLLLETGRHRCDGAAPFSGVDMSTSRSAFVCAAMTVLLAPAAAVHAQDSQEHIVQFRAGTPAAMRRAAAENAGATARFVYAGSAAATIRVPNEQSLAALRRNPSVLSIVPNRRVFASERTGANAKPGGAGGG